MVSKYKIITTVFPIAATSIIVGAPLITWGWEQSHNADHIKIHYDDSLISLSNRDAYLNKDFETFITINQPTDPLKPRKSLAKLDIYIGDYLLDESEYLQYSTEEGVTIKISGKHITDRFILFRATVEDECVIIFTGSTDKRVKSNIIDNKLELPFEIHGQFLPDPTSGIIVTIDQKMEPQYNLYHSDIEFNIDRKYYYSISPDDPNIGIFHVYLTFRDSQGESPTELIGKDFNLIFNFVSSISQTGVEYRDNDYHGELTQS